jgi:hypothetical protein
MDPRGGSWLIYALGGGWGHLTRAASLARAAQASHRIRIMTNSPYAIQAARGMPELDLIVFDRTVDAQNRAIEQIERADYECLIVDTFPRGLGGELAGLLGSLEVTKVLIHRDICPRYVAEAGLRTFVRLTYDLVLIPGESEATAFADLPAAVITKPWLIRDPRPRCSHRENPRILVCASGESSELPWFGAVIACLRAHYPGVEVRCVAPNCPPGCPEDCWIKHWPAADLYSTADVVIGGAGYNTIHECAAYQVPLIAHAWPRKYDRQERRATCAAQLGAVTIVATPEEAAFSAIRQLDLNPPGRPLLDFQNGAAAARALIESAITNPKTPASCDRPCERK